VIGKKRKKELLSLDIHYGTIYYHLYQNFMRKFYQDIISSYKNKTLDVILIPGDLLLYVKTYLDKEYFKCLKNDLINLSQSLSVPICISYGNHDLPLIKDEEDSKKRLDLAMNLDKREDGIFVLNNEQVLFGNLSITGFSPIRDAYSTFAMPSPALDMAYDSFKKCNFTFSKDNINILISHENKFFTYQSVAKRFEKNNIYKYISLIVGGHLHDGYVPLWFQKLFKDKLKDYGI